MHSYTITVVVTLSATGLFHSLWSIFCSFSRVVVLLVWQPLSLYLSKEKPPTVDR